jgi:hypothetical protein
MSNVHLRHHVLGEHHGFVVMYILGAHALGVPVEGL